MSRNDTFIQACLGRPVDRLPVWYMRQAGRSDPEYVKIKEKYNFSLLDICRKPELAAQITLMPVKKLGVDAAILYSDIMNPVASIGIDVDIVKSVGPVIHNPVRTLQDVQKLRPIDIEGDLSHIIETIRILHRESPVPLITFAGAPFTIASYLIEGKPSKSYILTKEMMYGEPKTWHLLMDKLGDMVIAYLKAHIEAGAEAVQLFDSWVGALSPRDFKEYVLPVITRIFRELSHLPQPKIYYPGVSSGELLPLLRELDAQVIGLDWRVSVNEGRRRLGDRFAIQGNLDPYVLTGPMSVVREQAKEIIDEGLERPGFIFNVGHGIFPEASIDKVKELTDFVHEYSEQALAARRKG